MNKKIKILEAIRQGQIGGGESHVYDLVTHLNKEVFEPIVLSFTEGPMVDRLREKGIKTYVIHTLKGFDMKVWKKVSALMQAEQIDIVHAHGTRANSNIMFAAKVNRIPLVYTVHGWSFHLDQPIKTRLARQYSEKVLTRLSNKTICVSKSNESTGKQKIGLRNSKVIYNAVNLNRFNPGLKVQDVRSELGIAKNKKVIGFIVRMTHQKDPFTMLYAMQTVVNQDPDVVLIMVGDGELKSQAIELAKELNLEKNVIFQPFRSDIPDILSAIDIYCLPSLWEGFPIGILEAMAMRKAVIASSVDGTQEMITHKQNGILIDHSNPKILASAIIDTLNNSTMMDCIAANAHEYVHKNFGIENMISDVQKEYVRLLQTSKNYQL